MSVLNKRDFKVGMKVRCIHTFYSSYHDVIFKLGRIYSITQISFNSKSKNNNENLIISNEIFVNDRYWFNLKQYHENGQIYIDKSNEVIYITYVYADL